MPVQTVDRRAGLYAALHELARTKVLVGVPSDAEQPHLGAAAGPNVRTGTQLTNAELAYIHTHGAPEVNIPARPFLAPAVARAQDKINTRLNAAAKAALAGDLGAVEGNLDAIGLMVQAEARNVIAEGIPPPLQPGTVAARARRTKGSKYRRKATAAGQRAFNAQFAATGSMAGSPTTPLYDTGQLVASISYVKRRER